MLETDDYEAGCEPRRMLRTVSRIFPVIYDRMAIPASYGSCPVCEPNVLDSHQCHPHSRPMLHSQTSKEGGVASLLVGCIYEGGGGLAAAYAVQGKSSIVVSRLVRACCLLGHSHLHTTLTMSYDARSETSAFLQRRE